MAKQTKAKTSESTTSSTTAPSTPIVQTAPVAVPVPVAASTTVPVVEKVKKVKAPKQVATPVEVAAPVSVVDAPVSTEAPAVQLVVEESPELDHSLLEKSAEFVAKLQQLGTLINSLKSEYKVLEKQWSRDLKVATKQCAKKKKRLGSRAPSGFVKPTRISDELAQFLEQPLGSEMARTEVTKNINQYIRQNNLQDKLNGRKIIPDAKLSVLLKIKKGEELTYFNLQRYMSCHFAKSKGVVASVAASV
jgi:chromatin remodeling complex protein RSC6